MWANEGTDGFDRAWKDFDLTGTYATPSEMLKDSALEAAQQRTLLFSIIRGNPKINGYSLTSLEDFFGAGEGVLTNFVTTRPDICRFCARVGHHYAGACCLIRKTFMRPTVARAGLSG